MMKLKYQYHSSRLRANMAAQNSRFAPKLADKVTSSLAGRLAWLWGWQHDLQQLYAQSLLKSLVNGWLGIQAVPAVAYVYLEDIRNRSHTGKSIPIRIRKMGSHVVN